MAGKNINISIVEDDFTLAAWRSSLVSSISTANTSGFIASVVSDALRIAAGIANLRWQHLSRSFAFLQCERNSGRLFCCCSRQSVHGSNCVVSSCTRLLDSFKAVVHGTSPLLCWIGSVISLSALSLATRSTVLEKSAHATFTCTALCAKVRGHACVHIVGTKHC